ncbi:hypothetical protein [Chryseobacterium sp. MMS23-Vi53]|uniref:hypothetical protein n=1 Tax=Chryseobacterium sp. MMS23-Vi53 TaxID=3386644 RepID=UPI0039E93EC3
MRFLILSFLLILSCKENNAKATDKEVALTAHVENKNETVKDNWSGEWIFEKKAGNADVPEEQFTLTIVQEGNHIKAQYCAIANNGGKIDCENGENYNVTGNIQNGKVVGEFFSFFGSASNKGKFEISSIDDNKIQWKVTGAPKGTFYAPDDCVLVKKDNSPVSQSSVAVSSNKSANLLPIDYKNLESRQKFADQPEEWLQKAFLQKFDLTADGSLKIFSKDNFDVYLIKNVGGDSELVYLVSTKGNNIVNGMNIADSNGDSETTKTFSIDEKTNISIFDDTGSKRKLIARYSFSQGQFNKK